MLALLRRRLADSVVVAPLLLAPLTAFAEALLELTRQIMVGTHCYALLCSLYSKASLFCSGVFAPVRGCAFERMCPGLAMLRAHFALQRSTFGSLLTHL
jgi:hypothetical protein